MRCYVGAEIKLTASLQHKARMYSFWETLKILQRFRLVKFTVKFKTRVKNLKLEKIVAFEKYLHKLFFAFNFHLSKNLFVTLKNNEVADLTYSYTKCGCF